MRLLKSTIKKLNKKSDNGLKDSNKQKISKVVGTDSKMANKRFFRFC